MLLATTAAVQQGTQQTGPRVQPSGRATTEVALVPAQRGAEPARIRIDYGQPHARGRTVAGTLIPYNQVWRTGANEATSLVTDVDLVLGGTRIPRGSYTLYSMLARNNEWRLIINRNTGQWGTQYDAERDLAHVRITKTELEVPAESFTITLVPSTQPPAQGTLVLRWGTLQGTVPWIVAQ